MGVHEVIGEGCPDAVRMAATHEPRMLVAVAAHKPYWMPSDPVYQPVWVGASLRQGEAPEGYVRDDGFPGSISKKNASFCELTATWWLWKTQAATHDYLGLAHYRRHFEAQTALDKKDRVATGEDLTRMLRQAPVLLPVERNYFIETNRSQYVHAHHAQDLDLTREILAERHPDYLPAYDRSMDLAHGHRFNMFVMRADLFDQYCAWLFDVLFELEARLDTMGYTPNDQRVFGFVAERLMDPWVQTVGVPYVELPVVNLESQHRVRKGGAFLWRKFMGKGGAPDA